MQVRLTGEGDIGSNGGPAGSLYVYLEALEHPFFRREGYDLVYPLSINLAEAALGAEKEVPTLDGEPETVKIPQGTQPGAEFHIRGKGIPQLNGNRRGDLRVLVDLQVPRSLSSHQRELLEELARSLDPHAEPDDDPGKSNGKERGLFERIKDALG